ncbi:hypothetical protein BO83DRAFT_75720 [Aspergillus eucalypticola CBS 122712]|uniref:Uncharacterized protein n=1 Tax=Aspergillus eucalypticola (strain CBS 122712 / IBT 29274) TaxID=1448314 RepID=A0A317V3N2_ASPEC|nr:uncharacterized protein BO83DRAFT_75720 [Aspergillus eucalypticola CBS 122712]PWY68884.1 hypothetical protein BO83DRAFT_75720 [Aspergillus eucalypticola CBS 122712]
MAPGEYLSLRHIPELVKLASLQPANQADCIPTTLSGPLPAVSQRLRGRLDLRIWDWEIQHALKCHGLEHLLRSDLPRPDKTHAKFALWRHWSITVRRWMNRQLSRKMKAKLGASRCAKKYADDAYNVIRDLGSHYNHAICKATWFKLIKMRRSHYTTVAQYISSFQRAYIDAKELGCGISPYCGLLEILRELESDLSYWVATVLIFLPEDAVTD